MVLRVHAEGGTGSGGSGTHRMYMMTPRDHMSHDLSYFSGPRTSGAARAEGTGEFSALRILEPRQEAEAWTRWETGAWAGAEPNGVWHLLGRQHVCKVEGGKTAPRKNKPTFRLGHKE